MLRVRAVDPSGNRDVTPVVWQWIEETLETSIQSGPPRVTNNRIARFRLDSTGSPEEFVCRLDRREIPCAFDLELAGLSDGEHSLEVRAARRRNGALVDQDTTPEIYRWRVDTIPPHTVLAGHPPWLTSETIASFAFAASEAGGFQCRGSRAAPFAACGSPLLLTRLSIGRHSLEVRAVDEAGNADPTPEWWTWTVTADLDGDGSLVGVDCDDIDPRRRPGAVDVPRTGIDEDCDGVDADYPMIGVADEYRVRYRSAGTVFARLHVLQVPGGTIVELRCRGSRGRCPMRPKTVRVRRDVRRVALHPSLGRRALAPGSRLEVRVKKPEMIGLVFRYRIRAGKPVLRTMLCLDPVAGAKPRRCGP